MARNLLTGLDRPRLKLWLFAFFVALAIPTALLIYHAYSQLKWETFHQHRMLAEEFVTRVDAEITALFKAEDARAFADYSFLVVEGGAKSGYVQRSSLSSYPVTSDIPGLIGYFQIDADGLLNTPLLPKNIQDAPRFGLVENDISLRRDTEEAIAKLLQDNRLVRERAPAPVPQDAAKPSALERTQTTKSEARRQAEAKSKASREVGQSVFDRLARSQPRRTAPVQDRMGKMGKLDALASQGSDEVAQSPRSVTNRLSSVRNAIKKRGSRKELSATLSDTRIGAGATATQPAAVSEDEAERFRITTFESEVDPIEIGLLNTGEMVMYRKVWREGKRYIQGALLKTDVFVSALIESPFQQTALSAMSNLSVAYQGEAIAALGGGASRDYYDSSGELTGTTLYRTQLSAPLSGLDILLTVNSLPAGPGGSVITWVAFVIAGVLCSGFYVLYRLGAKQIDLSRQQQDFVSAVSHELRTPLTSIRMYGEMLREGWASEEKKRTYYDYIVDESERLSRLITNVLQLARLTRSELHVEAKDVTVSELMDGLQSKVSSSIERAGFDVNLDVDEAISQAKINVDVDHFMQIMINLTDNAIKFAANGARKEIDIAAKPRSDGRVHFTVRDYGPGVPRDQMKKIFRLFYRTENELSRETVGTGIGLALVHQLTTAMQGAVDVENTEPGAQFRVTFPVVE